MKIKNLFIAVAVAVATLSFTGCFDLGSSYKPWADLSKYFDLDNVHKSGSMHHFNSFELCQNKKIYRNERLNSNEYSATVLGLNVLLRSDRVISPRTKIGSVNTGDIISVQGRSEYCNGKFWNYVCVSSGPNAGRCGYICTDYLIGQDQYDALRNYVFPQSSNISPKAESKYLNAISDILLKLDVNKYRPALFVDVVNAKHYGKKLVAAFQIRDLALKNNNSLLAFVEFTQGEYDYTVIGVVPGSYVHNINPLPNGSYDIYFAK